MVGYLKRHEAFVREQLTGEADWEGLARFHRMQIGFLQHERLIHLLVLLFVGLFTLVTLLFLVLRPVLWVFALLALFAALLIPYVVHYYQLENGVQRWYRLANEIEARAGNVPASHDAGGPRPA